MITERKKLDLGHVQETLLIPLYGRALETSRQDAILHDAKAVEMVHTIDYNFSRFDGARGLYGSVLRTVLFDQWVRAFMERHPGGTVVEVGAGLNTRFERLDDQSVRWFDLDLPDSIALRRHFFEDSERRTMLAASVLDATWVEQVQPAPGPYFFVAEAVFVYLSEPEVRQALALIARNFPGAWVAFDTRGTKLVESQHQHELMKKMTARFTWACDKPQAIERWGLGYRLEETRDLLDVAPALRKRMHLPWKHRSPIARLLFGSGVRSYRLNLFRAGTTRAEPTQR